MNAVLPCSADAASAEVCAAQATASAANATRMLMLFTFNAAVPLKAEIEKGAAFDVAILSTPITDDLVKQGKLVGATRADILRDYPYLEAEDIVAAIEYAARQV